MADKNTKSCSGDCLTCSPQQRLYCAAQMSRNVIEKIDSNETRLARIEEILNKLVDNDNIINPIQDAPGQKMFEPAQQGSGAENRLP